MGILKNLSPHLKVIALDFYDGVTEGFCETDEISLSYFKVIAWDDLQDKRLYITSSVEYEIANELISLIGETSNLTATPTCFVLEEFKNPVIQARVDELINLCKKNLHKNAGLMLGSDINEKNGLSHTDADILIEAIQLAMLNKRDNLAKWLPLLLKE